MADSNIQDLLQAANSASGSVRNTWVTYILFGAYLFVAVGATTPEQLLLEDPINLPLTGVKLPLRAFFQVVPWLFVLMHLYTLMQLYLLSGTLHLLNAAIDELGRDDSDRRQLRARIDGFMVTQLIAGGIQAWLPRQFARLATWITLLFAPVILLLLFQLQFLAYHDPFTTWCERLALVADLFLNWGLWIVILRPGGRFRDALGSWVASVAAALSNWTKLRSHMPIMWQLGKGMSILLHLAWPPAALVLSLAVVGFSFLIATVPGEASRLVIHGGRPQYCFPLA
jgi:hypothetical protein